METITIRITPEGLQIPKDNVDMVLDGDYWFVRPKNGKFNYEVSFEGFEQAWDEETAVLERNEEVYKILHPFLKQTHLGQYVAIHNDKVVDSDKDRIALRHRLTEAYPDRFISIRLVEEHFPRILRMPRIRLLPDTISQRSS